MIELKFTSAGRPANLTVENGREKIKDMLDYFTENQFDNEIIRAANTLDDINRCILAMYVANDLNLTKTAKQLRSSTQYLKKRLNQIIETVRNECDKEIIDEQLDTIHIL